MKIVKSSDKELVEKIDNKLKENKEKYGYAYCPCSLVKNKDTICICKEFLEREEEGPCHCGKYIKYKD